MNALIALLHFCEVHGPCAVFCTQTIHKTEFDCSETLNIPSSSSLKTDLGRIPSPPSLRSQQTNSIICPACTAQLPFVKGGEAKRLVTLDEDDPSIQYVGTKAPQQNHLYKAVRLACVRSLTAEFCPGRDGPVLFGDDENGYVMSYMFKLRDSQARGEARFYSLMMLMTDRVYLVSCWPFLVSAFKSMARNLQAYAEVVFQKEKELKQPSYYSITNSRRVASISQDQFFRRRSNTSLRSLVDLLGVKDIYGHIHAQFSYILKLSSRKRMEKLTPGRSASSLYIKMKEEYQAKKNEKKKEELVTTTDH
ncbi:hypothetical protein K501DRAFT_324120 [Backusella circina FSU 941]|nr:hypothetical protein K501DRAFT_324120 [Backusella circina FSU 941]